MSAQGKYNFYLVFTARRLSEAVKKLAPKPLGPLKKNSLKPWFCQMAYFPFSDSNYPYFPVHFTKI
jgi:hypothetical protein